MPYSAAASGGPWYIKAVKKRENRISGVAMSKPSALSTLAWLPSHQAVELQAKTALWGKTPQVANCTGWSISFSLNQIFPPLDSIKVPQIRELHGGNCHDLPIFSLMNPPFSHGNPTQLLAWEKTTLQVDCCLAIHGRFVAGESYIRWWWMMMNDD